jgi:hypothetical protein
MNNEDEFSSNCVAARGRDEGDVGGVGDQKGWAMERGWQRIANLVLVWTGACFAQVFVLACGWVFMLLAGMVGAWQSVNGWADSTIHKYLTGFCDTGSALCRPCSGIEIGYYLKYCA